MKTRLLTKLTPDEACAVHEALLLQTARSVANVGNADAEIWLDEIAGHTCLNAVADLGVRGPRQQAAGDLGEKMWAALSDGLARADEVLLVGSDCPGLDQAYLNSAFKHLANADLVIGPAEDGGYVLIGCRQLKPDVFKAIEWGESSVLQATLRALEKAELSVALLPERYDIDTPEDLFRWQKSNAAQ